MKKDELQNTVNTDSLETLVEDGDVHEDEENTADK